MIFSMSLIFYSFFFICYLWCKPLFLWECLLDFFEVECSSSFLGQFGWDCNKNESSLEDFVWISWDSSLLLCMLCSCTISAFLSSSLSLLWGEKLADFLLWRDFFELENSLVSVMRHLESLGCIIHLSTICLSVSVFVLFLLLKLKVHALLGLYWVKVALELAVNSPSVGFTVSLRLPLPPFNYSSVVGELLSLRCLWDRCSMLAGRDRRAEEPDTITPFSGSQQTHVFPIYMLLTS